MSPTAWDPRGNNHAVPHILERRLRSPECRAGRDTCTDPQCLCACHEQTHDDHWTRVVITALDTLYWEFQHTDTTQRLVTLHGFTPDEALAIINADTDDDAA